MQGVGAAIISPATLSIITTTFAEGAERNKALGIWGAMGGSGAAAGVLFGGLLTKYLGWKWIFFVNVPVAALVLLLTPRFVPRAASRATGLRRRRRGHGHGGQRAARLRISRAPVEGWGTVEDDRPLVVAAVLLVAFVVIEGRAGTR